MPVLVGTLFLHTCTIKESFLFAVDADGDGCVGCRFFAGYRVRPDGIHFVMHADGRPSGMAFVEFDCPQEAMRAFVILSC